MVEYNVTCSGERLTREDADRFDLNRGLDYPVVPASCDGSWTWYVVGPGDEISTELWEKGSGKERVTYIIPSGGLPDPPQAPRELFATVDEYLRSCCTVKED